MTIIAAFRYRAGERLPDPVVLDGTPRDELPDRAFDWVGLAMPEMAEMEMLRHQYGLHPLAIEDALSPGQLPKVDVYGRHLFIVARTAEMTEGEIIDYGQTSLFVGRDFIITVRLGSMRAHTELRQRLELAPERLAEGPDYVAHAILDFIVDGYAPLLERLEEAVQGIEEGAIGTFPQSSTIRRIFRLRRQLRRFQRVAGPMEAVCDRLASTELPAIDPSARVWFRDVYDHVRRALQRVAGLIETLVSVVETAALLEQHRQGDMTRQLAAWAAILAVPTAIAGIYGMNFDYMPELHQRWGYPAVLAGIATVCVGLYWRFRQIGWL